jgi:hypothetical protein
VGGAGGVDENLGVWEMLQQQIRIAQRDTSSLPDSLLRFAVQSAVIGLLPQALVRGRFPTVLEILQMGLTIQTRIIHRNSTHRELCDFLFISPLGTPCKRFS